ncbi:MAG: outer membrane beta-barrel protein [Bacteroidota bacterium]
MKNARFLCFILLLSGALFSQAQTDSTETDSAEDNSEAVLVIPPINEQLKVGIKFGSGVCTLLGNELANPRPSYMLSGGAYLRYRFKRHWFIQPEACITYKGSNFNNGTAQYQSVRMYYIDVPVLLMLGLNDENTSNVFVGLQYSRLLNASLYLKDAPLPESTAPAIKKDDLAAVLGTQFHTPFVGFQIAVKYGLIDINNGLLPNLNPPNTGKDIHHFTIEINFLF